MKYLSIGLIVLGLLFGAKVFAEAYYHTEQANWNFTQTNVGKFIDPDNGVVCYVAHNDIPYMGGSGISCLKLDANKK